MKNFLIGLIALIAVFTSCHSNTPPPTPTAADTFVANHWMMKYAGGYYIDVEGFNDNRNMESYILRTDGTAKWMWIVNDGNGGAIVQSKKNGKWLAFDSHITINIKGNTGTLTENYTLVDGRFVNDEKPNRSLSLVPSQ